MVSLIPPARSTRQRWGQKKRAAKVSVDRDVLAAAKALKLNLSAVLEDALKRRLREERQRALEKEGRAAIESYNRFIEENGSWGEEYRDW